MSDNPIIHPDISANPLKLEKTEYEANTAHTITGIKIGDAPTELTMTAGGVITATQSWHTVDTFGDAASDALVQVTGLKQGWFYLLQAEHTDRTVVITHGASIRTFAGQDFSLSNTNRGWFGFCPDGAILIEVVRMSNV